VVEFTFPFLALLPLIKILKWSSQGSKFSGLLDNGTSVLELSKTKLTPICLPLNPQLCYSLPSSWQLSQSGILGLKCIKEIHKLGFCLFHKIFFDFHRDPVQCDLLFATFIMIALRICFITQHGMSYGPGGWTAD
jgi:hypothetical protein